MHSTCFIRTPFHPEKPRSMPHSLYLFHPAFPNNTIVGNNVPMHFYHVALSGKSLELAPTATVNTPVSGITQFCLPTLQ